LLSGETFYNAEANTPVISIGQEENIALSGGGSEGFILASLQRFPLGVTGRIIDFC
jgi:hypothetical protein